MAIKQELEARHLEVPDWCLKFRCDILKPETPLEVRQLVAGRKQAKQQAAIQLTLLETMQIFSKQVAKYREQRPDSDSIPMKEILHNTYMVSGQSVSQSGSFVCLSLCCDLFF